MFDFITIFAANSLAGPLILGMLIALILVVIGSITYVRHNQKNDASVIVGSRREAKTEKVKADIILSAIDDGVVLINADQSIQVFNNAAATLTGWAQDEAIGLDYHSVFHILDARGNTYQPEEYAFQKVFNSQQAQRDSNGVLLTKNGKQLPIQLNVSPILDAQNNVTAVVGVFRDVSQERATEQQRADFISTASHEMRTPVAAIEGYLALALNEHVTNIDAKARDYLEKAHSSTQHLGKLFQDLLTSAKAEDGRLVYKPLVVEFGEFLEQTTDNLRFAAEKKGLKVEFIIGTSDSTPKTTSGEKVIRPLYYALVDPDRFREVITNIFDNAVKYTEKGSISIGLTGDDNVVQMYIKDSGAGIPQEDLPHLFQKFYRVDNSASRTIGGTGLGLFISRKIVELSNGRLWVDSKLQQGSTFYINLPRISAQKAQSLKSQEAKNKLPLG